MPHQSRPARAFVGLVALLLASIFLACAGAPAPAARPSKPESSEVRLAAEAMAAGDDATARTHLEAAVAADPGDFVAHQRLAALTGSAPLEEPATVDAAVELANRHPYDPRALLAAGRALVDAGRGDEAMPALETAVYLASRAPRAGAEAVALLQDLSPEWRASRIVHVVALADEALRDVEGWRFRLRDLWDTAEATLEPFLRTRFVLVSLDSFEVRGVGPRLEDMLSAMARRTGFRRRGIAAGFTAEPLPDEPGAKRGIAEYLGTHVVVRDEGEGRTPRTLSHEVAHLYGAVHVVDERQSLMNVSGDSRRLDARNARILRALAGRHFFPGGPEENVIPALDLSEAIAAFTDVLMFDLTYRKLGLDAALAGRPGADRRAQRDAQLDPHLGDVSVFLSRLLWEDQRRDEALTVLEAAVNLYGPDSHRGRAADDRLEQRYREMGRWR